MNQIEKECIYTQIDSIMDNISAEQLAEYIYMNNPRYATELEFSLGVCEIEDIRQSRIELCNNALVTEDKDTEII